jgi:ferric-dicitrate binding protein FerR (iron transport regulator)
MKIVLQDGSIVRLSPHAKIRWQEPFPTDKREIYLQGQAFFDVARDNTAPFTVYSEWWSATALGTSFTVTQTRTAFKVKLYTGKVVVKANQQYVKGWSKPVYLAPGEQLQYDTLKSVAVITRFDRQRKMDKEPEPKTAGITRDEEALMFDNTPLAEVMNKLMKRYHRSIEYNKTEISDMYFSGSVLKNDSLAVLLKVIAQLNRLTVTEKPGGFVIQKN